jgi:hypothetical protein
MLEKLVFGYFSDQFEHVLIVVPEAIVKFGGGKVLAYAFFARQPFRRHRPNEIGHNMNLHHAGTSQDGLVYGYELRSLSYGSCQEIKSCFNAQEHWSLGWFEDRALSLDVEDLPWAGYLAAVVDYNMTSLDQNVIVHVGQSNPRLFLQYNRAKGINADTRELGDRCRCGWGRLSLPGLWWPRCRPRHEGLRVDRESTGFGPVEHPP